jgi:hypothetical protein
MEKMILDQEAEASKYYDTDKNLRKADKFLKKLSK